MNSPFYKAMSYSTVNPSSKHENLHEAYQQLELQRSHQKRDASNSSEKPPLSKPQSFTQRNPSIHSLQYIKNSSTFEPNKNKPLIENDLSYFLHRINEHQKKMMDYEFRLAKVQNRKENINIQEKMVQVFDQYMSQLDIDGKLKKLEEILFNIKNKKEDSIRYNVPLNYEEKLKTIESRTSGLAEKTQYLDQQTKSIYNKIEVQLNGLSSKYEEFIEKFFIENIQKMNQMVDNCQKQISNVKVNQNFILEDFHQLKSKMPKISNNLLDNIGIKSKGIVFDNIFIIQRLSITNKPPKTTSKLGQNIRNKLNSSQCPQSNDQPNTTSNNNKPKETLLNQITYKIDNNYFLLDENDNYIKSQEGVFVQLKKQQIQVLKVEGILM